MKKQINTPLYSPTIGLEIHLQLATKSKMFCGCPIAKENDPPNTKVCPVCLAHPGTLPVINKQAVEFVVKAGLALDCEIAETTKFDRKNYFYPDLPKGYQISQYDLPIAAKGHLMVGENKIGITRIHLEEDTGKLMHPENSTDTLVDFNRAGTPLMELVTEPDIKSGEQAKEFCAEIQKIMRYLKISNADMEKGQMRCEVNISVSKDEKRGTKVEVKNLNSFRSVQKSIDYEIKRQSEALEKGEKIIQETRGWDEKKQITISQRVKEEAHDYRYFPEPDLPPIKLAHEMPAFVGRSRPDFVRRRPDKKCWDEQVINVPCLKAELPELPQKKFHRFQEQYGFKPADAQIIIADKNLADYAEAVISELHSWLLSLENLEGSEEEKWEKNKPKIIKLTSGWLLSELFKLLNEKNQTIADVKITPENFAEFLSLVYLRKVNSTTAQALLKEMFNTGGDPSNILEEKDLGQIDDEGSLEEIVEKVINAHPKQVEEYKSGKEPVLQFLVGMVMRESKGKANPERVSKILKNKLK